MIEVTKLAMTKHCTQDRLDRLVEISMTVGWGNILYEYTNPTTNNIEALSDTGVLFIVTPNREALVTAYLPSFEKACAVALSTGNKIPKWLVEKIVKNRIKKG